MKEAKKGIKTPQKQHIPAHTEFGDRKRVRVFKWWKN